MVLPPDVLKRSDYVEMVRQVIENKIDNKAGYSLADDGNLGISETYVLKYWKNISKTVRFFSTTPKKLNITVYH